MKQRVFPVLVLLLALAWTLSGPSAVPAQGVLAPGGFVGATTSTDARAQPTASQIAQFVPPTRGRFTFPAPYRTEAYRLTIPSDCGGGDCVEHTGYSDWRNINNHVGRPVVRVFLSLAGQTGFGGPTLFSIDKATGAVTNDGPIFSGNDALRGSRAEGWYWSATDPDVIYGQRDGRLIRVNVVTRQQSTVLDLTTQGALFGSANVKVWSPHSSDDDLVHVGTVKLNGEPYTDLGCYVYQEATRRWRFFRTPVDCFIDKSGRYVGLYDQIDNKNSVDLRTVDLSTGQEGPVLLDENGAPGHQDWGFGYLIGEDNFNPLAQALRLWDLSAPWTAPGQGKVVWHMPTWGNSFVQPAFGNAVSRAIKPIDKQYMCSLTTFERAPTPAAPLEREIVCFMLDGSLRTLVVAPSMIDMTAAGGGIQYNKAAKGNLDVTGRYYVWTTNMGGNRLDAFVVRIPAHVLTGETPDDVDPPTVAITGPKPGAGVSGSVEVSATATDNTRVVGVQFQLDGMDLGAEDTSAPYSATWDTATSATGPHVLIAVARDAAGNAARSTPVSVSIGGGSAGGSAAAVVARCDRSMPMHGTTTDGGLIVPASQGQRVYLCQVTMTAASATTLSLVQGSGDRCSASRSLLGVYRLSAGAPIIARSLSGGIGQSICWSQSAAASVFGTLTYGVF